MLEKLYLAITLMAIDWVEELKMRKVGIILVKIYQKIIPTHYRACCRFHPTCSDYAIAALSKYGLFKGSWLALKRILRCNPIGGSGYDPLL